MPSIIDHGQTGKVRTPAKIEWSEMKKFIRDLWPYLRHEKLSFILIFILIILTTVFQLIGPLLVSQVIDKYILQGRFSEIFNIIIVLVLVYLFASVTNLLQEFFLARIVPRVIKKIRSDSYIRLLHLPLSFFDREPFGETMSRLTNDLDNLDMALSTTTTQIFSSVLIVVGALCLMFYQNIWLALATVLTVPLTLLLTKLIASKSGKYFSAQQKDLAEINGYAEETLSASILIKAYGTENKIISRFNKLVEKYYQSNFKAQFFAGLMMTSIILLNNLNIVILATLGGFLAFSGFLAIGILASFLQYQKQFTRPLGTLANQFMTLQLAFISGKRVMEIINATRETESIAPLEKLTLTQTLEIKDLSFGYNSTNLVLKNINLKANAGQTLALVGPTGSGKTTLASLILRFYDPESGGIFFDKQNINLATRSQVRSLVGFVLQDVSLFSGKIKDNIRFGRLEASDEEVVDAAKKAHADEFISHLENGYDTDINGNSVVLSQGQKQLLSIARAFLADPPILILDEATSNVDTLTEFAIQQGMQKLLHGRLSLVIAHRLSTVKNSDLILVMKNGEIIERGTHNQLLHAKGFYAQIYHSQDADLLE